jgi:hypothetical protein
MSFTEFQPCGFQVTDRVWFPEAEAHAMIIHNATHNKPASNMYTWNNAVIYFSPDRHVDEYSDIYCYTHDVIHIFHSEIDRPTRINFSLCLPADKTRIRLVQQGSDRCVRSMCYDRLME